jgi:hypothetical protein
MTGRIAMARAPRLVTVRSLAVCLSPFLVALLIGPPAGLANTKEPDIPDPCVPSVAVTPLQSGRVLVTGVVDLSADDTSALFDPVSGSVTPSGAMVVPRLGHTATLLADGRVLVVGGEDSAEFMPLADAEAYDETTASFTQAGSMLEERWGHTTTLLADHQVLVVGGGTASAELYDPVSDSFTATGTTTGNRVEHTATLLGDGRVLIAGGGRRALGRPLASAELLDPVSGTFDTTGPMVERRAGHTATLLPDGRVLVAGGLGRRRALASAELYDPVTGTFAPIGTMTTPRSHHVSVRLSDGRVLLVGGGRRSWCDSGQAGAELYDPSDGSFLRTGRMAQGQGLAVAALLPDDRVLIVHDSIVGPSPSLETALETAELYDPITGSFSILEANAAPAP